MSDHPKAQPAATSQPSRCSSCVQSAAFPRIQFDAQGICNYCRNQAGALTQDKTIGKAKQNVKQLLSNLDPATPYDAIMCYSGGKDSSYTLKLAVEKYGLRILSFTLDNGFISETAFANINRVVDHLGVDHLVFRPAQKHFVPMVRASALKSIYPPKTLNRISAVCNTCISMVNTYALKLAIEKRVPYILAGFTLGQIPANAIVYKNNYRFLQESREKSLQKLRQEAGPFVDNYLSIPEETIAQVQAYPSTINLLCLEDITEAQIIEQVQTMGWCSPSDVDGCSSNCLLNTFNNDIHEKTFGYNPYELELSHLIRKGLMTRDEALQKIQQQPKQQLQQIQKLLGISDADLKGLATNND